MDTSSRLGRSSITGILVLLAAVAAVSKKYTLQKAVPVLDNNNNVQLYKYNNRPWQMCVRCVLTGNSWLLVQTVIMILSPTKLDTYEYFIHSHESHIEVDIIIPQ